MSGGYDRAITVFSPDGHLLQVEYAQEAVRKGCTAIGVLGKDCVVLGVEKKSIAMLQEERTVRKICPLDSHIVMAFAGLTADARVIINRAQMECQSQYLTLGETVTIEYITRFVASIKQKYTQSNGRRPFGISCLIAGFNNNGTPHLFQTEPSGIYYEWKANATGRNSKLVKEFLQDNYNDEAVSTEQGTIKLAVRALLEVVQSGQKNIELVVLKNNEKMKMLDPASLEEMVNVIEAEKEALEKEKNKQKDKQ